MLRVKIIYMDTHQGQCAVHGNKCRQEIYRVYLHLQVDHRGNTAILIRFNEGWQLPSRP